MLPDFKLKRKYTLKQGIRPIVHILNKFLMYEGGKVLLLCKLVGQKSNPAQQEIQDRLTGRSNRSVPINTGKPKHPAAGTRPERQNNTQNPNQTAILQA
jgi:hypothetical protein